MRPNPTRVVEPAKKKKKNIKINLKEIVLEGVD
jgi:hypothetical protein